MYHCISIDVDKLNQFLLFFERCLPHSSRAFAGPDGEVPAKLVIEDAFLNDGHIQQKYSKLTADLHTEAEFILHIDSDLR